MSRKLKDAALAEELPYWDFIDGSTAHAILFDGSLVGGIKVGLIGLVRRSVEIRRSSGMFFM